MRALALDSLTDLPDKWAYAARAPTTDTCEGRSRCHSGGECAGGLAQGAGIPRRRGPAYSGAVGETTWPAVPALWVGEEVMMMI